MDFFFRNDLVSDPDHDHDHDYDNNNNSGNNNIYIKKFSHPVGFLQRGPDLE